MANTSQNKSVSYLLQAQHWINAALGEMTGGSSTQPQRSTHPRAVTQSTTRRRTRGNVSRIKGGTQQPSKAA